MQAGDIVRITPDNFRQIKSGWRGHPYAIEALAFFKKPQKILRLTDDGAYAIFEWGPECKLFGRTGTWNYQLTKLAPMAEKGPCSCSWKHCQKDKVVVECKSETSSNSTPTT